MILFSFGSLFSLNSNLLDPGRTVHQWLQPADENVDYYDSFTDFANSEIYWGVVLLSIE